MPSVNKKLQNPVNLLFITAVFGSILYISLIFNDNLWVDEAFTASIIREAPVDLIRDTIRDTLPPFYNIYGKLLTLLFGYSSYVLKFGSCVSLILLIFFGGRSLYDLFGFRAAWFFELFLFTMPYFLHYAVEIRMYSFGMLCCGMASCYFAAILKNRSHIRGFVLFTVFAGYVHHFALVSCGGLWFMLLLAILVKKDREDLKIFIKSLLAFLALYLPGLILTVYQIKNASSYFSMAPLSLHSFLSDLRFPFVTNLTPLSALLLIIVATVALASISLLVKGFRSGLSPDIELLTGLLLMSVFLFTLVFGYFSSFLAGRSIFTARYLSPCLPIFWMGAALLLDRCLEYTGNNRLFLSIVLAATAFAGVFGYMNAYREEYKSGVSEMKAYFSENTEPGDAFLIFEDNYEIEICFRYYFPWLKKTKWKKIDEAKGKLFLIETSESDLENCRDKGYDPIYIGDYSFDRYSFSLYELKGI